MTTETTFDKLLTAQDVLPTKLEWWTSEFAQGFNIKINGATWLEFKEFKINSAGFEYAQKLIDDGEIFFINSFQCERADCPVRFQYGGFWACNTCNTHIRTPDWWKIKVMKDGNAFCCIGEGFINLQESENYAFGDTKKEAIDNYRKLTIAE